MSSAFVELLQKSNLDYIITRKSLKTGSTNEDLIFTSLINTKTKKLQLIACLNKTDSVILWSTSLDERAFQLNTRLLDLTELNETMLFLSERIKSSDFILTKAISTNNKDQNEISQINVTFTHPKNKQSITLHLSEDTDENEKALVLSKILLHVYKHNEQLLNEVQTQQIRIKELSTKTSQVQYSTNQLFDGNDPKTNLNKPQDRTKMSLINPTAKRRKAATGVIYGDDDSD